jgi:hypothetical protein
MTKLHELLSVAGNLKSQADKTRTDLMETFEKKRHLFGEKVQSFTPILEGAQTVVESQSDLQSTVPKELSWIKSHLAKALDVQYQIAVANTEAHADVVLEDGISILKNLPATGLLELENRIQEIQALVVKVPTLDPAKGFEICTERGKGIFKAREITKPRTKKVTKVLVKYAATKEHPAQTELVNEDVVVGSILEQEWSGMITPAAKADMLDRCEQLQRAVKRARSRANEMEVDVASMKIGKVLLDYVFEGNSV